MKIHSIRIKGLQQYNDTFIDFTNPETGKPANKICIIGKNGTGKSTLLQLLANILNQIEGPHHYVSGHNINIAVKFNFEESKYYLFFNDNGSYFFTENVESDIPHWFDILTSYNGNEAHRLIQENFKAYLVEDRHLLIKNIKLKGNSSDLLIISAAESFQNAHLNLWDVPNTNLNEALSLFNQFPYYHNISNETVTEFWKILIFLIKKRENERDVFENSENNLHKTKQVLIDEFEEISPKILDKIAELWNDILGNAGLVFDVEKARNPIQLSDNLNAYIILKRSKERISYSSLSTGIRNFIFRIGHIYSLYFNRVIKRGFVFIDEPENSLFPDFLFELVGIYERVLVDKNKENNSQLFMSTHNPIIAAQFEPHERVILEWNEEGYVEAFKGVAPIGDDPNDVLLKDFRLTHVMGKKGVEFWEEYMRLKKELRRTNDAKRKEELVGLISEIGGKYNFD